MLISIENELRTVEISTLGGELQSIRTKENVEYLWQGNPEFWAGRATNLFPHIARLTQGKYHYHGNEYSMEIHGFLKKSEMKVDQLEKDFVRLTLDSNENTLQQYPFPFHLSLEYRLCETRLNITCKVDNPGQETMHFGYGGHPGFFVPLEDNCKFEDYYLEFNETCFPTRIGFSEQHFPNGQDEPFPLEEGKYLHLQHQLFDDDAIVLKDMASQITLKTSGGKRSVTVGYPDMKYFGIWHKPFKEAPYVCLEPWSSLPSRDQVIEDLETQENLMHVLPGHTYTNEWWIQCD